MHAAAISPRGGVAPETTRLRGQGIIEYVLIIAVIGLVIVFAGPGVAGAIRNQFNLVGNTVNNGTSGGTEGGASGGGSTGADSATVQAAIAKDAKDWTLDEQKAAAPDIAKNGTSSVIYAKAKAAMDAGTTWSVKLTNGKTITYRIVGINHDDLADGSGKAGLTFEAVNGAFGEQCVDSEMYDGDRWTDTELRQRLNTGDLWSLLPNELAGRIATVTKYNHDPIGQYSMADKLFILNTYEVYGGSYEVDGAHASQYEYYSSKGISDSSQTGASLGFDRWMRTTYPPDSSKICYIRANGDSGKKLASEECFVVPAWCF